MANDAIKKLYAQNTATMRKYTAVLIGVNALYILYRMVYLWDSFSAWHMASFGLTTTVYLAIYIFFAKSASPKYAPLAEGGKLVSAGVDLDQKGLIEYCWDMLYTTMFVQLASGFVSDWFWLLYLVPPSIGMYYLWTGVIYPWISRPDPEQTPPPGQKPPRPGERMKRRS